MPYIYLIGLGVGHLDYLTEQARRVIIQCDIVLGAKRLIESIKGLNDRGEACTLEEIEERIEAYKEVDVIGVVVSGDVGFYSLANRLRKSFQNKYAFAQISGISSMQYFMNALGKSYDDLCTVSMHGREGNLIERLTEYRSVFVLIGGCHSVSTICEALCDNGFEEATVYVGEKLSYPDERITRGTPATFKNQPFDVLSVMLIEQNNIKVKDFKGPGLPDEAFIRGKVPMTKCEVRAICLSKLQLFPEAIVYDIGAGTGSVSIEMAMQVSKGKVYALERNETAIKLIEANKRQFNIENIEIRNINCPDGLEDLPAPDAVFIGGSGGKLGAILKQILFKNPRARFVITAITLETLVEALEYFKTYSLMDEEIIQVSVASSKKVGSYHMMTGQNPIFILSGQGGSRDYGTNNNLLFTRGDRKKEL